jgi:hypothetical protein
MEKMGVETKLVSISSRNMNEITSFELKHYPYVNEKNFLSKMWMDRGIHGYTTISCIANLTSLKIWLKKP